jgi:hypothetical protein
MGLYGALIVRPTGAPGQAYGDADTAFDHEAVLVLSEIDKNLNNLADPNTFDLNDYDPTYWLINGEAHPATNHIAAIADNDVLLRYLNAGSTHHTMSLLGMHQRVIATDASLLPFPLEAVSQTIPTGQTADAIATPPCAGNYALYNRQLRVTTALPGALNHFPGGMQTFMDVTGAACAAPPPGANPVLYFSTLNVVDVPGTAAGTGDDDDSDIYQFNDDNTFTRLWDATANGVPSSSDVDALKVIDADTFYLSFVAGWTVPGVGGIADEDIVLFNAGTWSLFFDGSDVGLGNNGGEDVDAFEILSDGSVVVSVIGAPTATPDVPGITGEADEDLLRCTGTFGSATSCTWSMYFEGSDVGLSTNDGEDVDAADVSGSNVLLSTLGSFGVSGLSGADEDVFVCNGGTRGSATTCGSFALFFDGSAFGLTDDIDALDAVGP